MRPPENRIGDIFAVRGINHQVIRLAGGAEGLLDQRIVVGHDNDQRRRNGREKFVEKTALILVIQNFAQALAQRATAGDIGVVGGNFGEVAPVRRSVATVTRR